MNYLASFPIKRIINSMKKTIIISLCLIPIFVMVFFLRYSIINVPAEFEALLGVDGETYLIVKKPYPLAKTFVNIKGEVGSFAQTSLAKVFSKEKAVKTPWYLEVDYLQANTLIVFNTKAGFKKQLEQNK